MSEGRISSDNCTCCHFQTDDADQLTTSPRHRILTPGKPVPSVDLTTPGIWKGVATRDEYCILKSLVCLDPDKASSEKQCLGPGLTLSGLCLVAGSLNPSNMLVYLRDGSAKTSLRADTLRQKLQIKFSTSPSHSILTPGRPVPELIIQRQAPGRVATECRFLSHCYDSTLKNPVASGIRTPDPPLSRRTPSHWTIKGLTDTNQKCFSPTGRNQAKIFYHTPRWAGGVGYPPQERQLVSS